jgi:hypothetical protein
MPICIYCLAEKPAAAFSREHVLTRAFCGQGENWTLRELVCAECNNKLSKFEAHWTSSAIESVMRNASGPRGRTAKSGERSQPVEIDELYLVQGDDPLVYEAGFAFPTEFYFRPQLIESKDGLIGVAADQRGGDALEAMMAAEVRKVPIIVTEPLPVPEDATKVHGA